MLKGFIFLLVMLSMVACDRVRNKGHELAGRAEQRVKNKSRDLVDKVLPQFDAYEADTKFNQMRFREFLGVALTPDVRDIYCYDDPLGIDQDYQFSFHCDGATVNRIIAANHLAPDQSNHDFAFGLQDDFDWWDKRKIARLKLYLWEGDRQYFKYFWYDPDEQKAYYFDFDL